MNSTTDQQMQRKRLVAELEALNAGGAEQAIVELRRVDAAAQTVVAKHEAALRQAAIARGKTSEAVRIAAAQLERQRATLEAQLREQTPAVLGDLVTELDERIEGLRIHGVSDVLIPASRDQFGAIPEAGHFGVTLQRSTNVADVEQAVTALRGALVQVQALALTALSAPDIVARAHAIVDMALTNLPEQARDAASLPR